MSGRYDDNYATPPVPAAFHFVAGFIVGMCLTAVAFAGAALMLLYAAGF